MALLHRLRTRTRCHTLSNPSPFHHRLLSTSNSGGGDDPNPKSPFASYFREARDNLKQRPPSPSSPSSPSSSNSKQSSMHEIMNNLSEFRRRTSVPPPGNPSSPPQSQQISFQDLYNQNVRGKSGQSPDSGPTNPGSSNASFGAIRGRLGQMRNGRTSPGLNTPKSPLFSGTGGLPGPGFAPEMRGKAGGPSTQLDFLRPYSHEDLGKKLTALRPDVKGKDWFSIGELHERLRKLREVEVIEAQNSGSEFHGTLMDALKRIDEKGNNTKKITPMKMGTLSLLGETPDYLMKPPKEHLVEKYFHPDNLCSAEKLKMELTKVRDEFKMSESDCGSARVQVAQLTTKIKHLSSVLHKKDVHSRKGLVAMVQQRKKLLKYLRRTDWDSYCFVISKLGLRDNPDHSHKIRTKAGSNEKTASKAVSGNKKKSKKKSKKSTPQVAEKVAA